MNKLSFFGKWRYNVCGQNACRESRYGGHKSHGRQCGIILALACVLAFPMLGMTACSIIPMASIRYLKSVEQGGLENAKAENVRVAMNLPSDAQITSFVADISGVTNDDKVEEALPFVAVPVTEALGTAPGDGKGVWTYYELTPSGRSGFEKIQAFAARHLPGGKEPVTITVKLHNKLTLARCDLKGKEPLAAAILLDPQRGYVLVWNHDMALSDLATPANRTCLSKSR